MSVNKYQPHILVLPEDDANRQIANGFILAQNINGRAIQILPEVGGWRKVIDKFKEYHISEMRKYSDRRLILLIDFDNQEGRLEHVKNQIPDDLKKKVFILGVWSEPEKLKAAIQKNFEEIGETLAEECPNSRSDSWNHELLKHNENELKRTTLSVKLFLFD